LSGDNEIGLNFKGKFPPIPQKVDGMNKCDEVGGGLTPIFVVSFGKTSSFHFLIY
jgi:hypothetical protein